MCLRIHVRCGLWFFLLLPGFVVAGPFAYVTNTAPATVQVIDTATNALVATVPVGNFPIGIAVNRDGTRVYIANSLSNNVSVLDAATNTVIATVPVNRPTSVALHPDGTRVYVVRKAPNGVSVIDTMANTVIATIAIGVHGEESGAVAVNQGGTRLYVISAAGVGISTVTVVDTVTDTVIKSVVVCGSPPGGIAADQSHVFVAGMYCGVTVIDGATNTVVATLPLIGEPSAVAVNPVMPRAYVTNSSSPGSVWVVDTMELPLFLRTRSNA